MFAKPMIDNYSCRRSFWTILESFEIIQRIVFKKPEVKAKGRKELLDFTTFSARLTGPGLAGSVG